MVRAVQLDKMFRVQISSGEHGEPHAQLIHRLADDSRSQATFSSFWTAT